MLPSDTTLNNRHRIIYTLDERPGNIVYRGRDEQTGRLVLIAEIADSAQRRNDLIALANQVASVQHTAILALVDHFVVGDLFYLVAKDPGGQDLERSVRARGGPLPEESTRAQLAVLLDAIEYLHAQKVPLFLGDPLPSDVWISDDGAWHLTPFTLIRPILHTPSPFRAPELDQPTAEPTVVSDIYAVNALLYYALTGWVPPTNAQRVAGTPLNSPRTLNSALSNLVEQVLVRGLQLRPENRYQAARELRLSLDLVTLMDGHVSGNTVSTGQTVNVPAPPIVPAQQTGTTTFTPSTPAAAYSPQTAPPYPSAAPPATKRRSRTGCLIAVAVTITLLFLLACVILLAIVLPSRLLPRLFDAVQAPRESLSAGQPTVAPSAPIALGAQAITLQNASQITQTHVITSSVLGPVAYSPDGKILAVGSSNAIYLRNAVSLEPLQPIAELDGHTGAVFTLSWSPDSSILASGAMDDNTIRLWDMQKGQLLRELKGHTGWIRSVAFSPDGKLLVSGSFDQNVQLWDVAHGTSIWSANAHSDLISAVVFTPDGSAFASSSRDGTVRVWDVAQEQVRTKFSYRAPINKANNTLFWTTGIAFTPDGKLMAIGLQNGAVDLVDSTTGTLLHTIQAHDDIVVSRGVAFSPDGKLLATASFDGSVRLWDSATGARIALLNDRSQVIALSFSADGTHIAAANDWGGQLQIWDVRQPDTVRAFAIGQGVLRSIVFSPDSSELGTVGSNGTTYIRSLADDRSRSELGVETANKSLAFLDHNRFVTINDKHVVTLFNQRDVQKLVDSGDPPLNIVTSGDGTLIVAGTLNGEIEMWDGATGAVKPSIRSGLSVIFELAANADGSLVAVGGIPSEPKIEVWDVKTRQLRQTLTGYTNQLTGFAFAPRSNLLAAADSEGGLWIWDAATGRVLQSLHASAERGVFTALAWSPDEDMLLTGSLNGDLTFFNTQTGAEVTHLLLPDGGVFALAYSPDGQVIAAGLSDQTLRIFEVETH